MTMPGYTKSTQSLYSPWKIFVGSIPEPVPQKRNKHSRPPHKNHNANATTLALATDLDALNPPIPTAKREHLHQTISTNYNRPYKAVKSPITALSVITSIVLPSTGRRGLQGQDCQSATYNDNKLEQARGEALKPSITPSISADAARRA